MGCHKLSYYKEETLLKKHVSDDDYGGVMPGRNEVLATPYRFGYQGQEKAAGQSKWDNFKLRMYNADLGRFMSIDPYSQFHSPYLAMADNPVSFIDPDGGCSYDRYARSAHRQYLQDKQRRWEEMPPLPQASRLCLK